VTTDRTAKRDRRDRKRRKRWPVHGRSLVHVMNAIRKRGRKKRDKNAEPPA
jgi:hypothetical protein